MAITHFHPLGKNPSSATVVQNTPGTEAPAEMNTWFPQWNTFWAAENIVATIHNIYTFRGALVRDALEWSRQINRALHLFGKDAE